MIKIDNRFFLDIFLFHNDTLIFLSHCNLAIQISVINKLFLFTAASGPVRLFTPYKRRRKIKSDGQDSNTSMDNGQSASVATQNTVTITATPVVTTHNNNTNSTINPSIITTPHNTTPQQLHIQTTPIQSSNHNNNNTVTINANNGIKKKRFSVNIVNVKPSGAESSNDVDENAITFTPAVAPPSSVKEESITPWQTVTEAIQEIPADYVDQTREHLIIC